MGRTRLLVLLGLALLSVGEAAPRRTVTLAWTLGVGLPPALYAVQRRPDWGMWTTIATLEADARTYTDGAPLKYGCYRLEFPDQDQQTTWSNTVCTRR
jgi:hypothetical protein